jgi:hypothetical protein
VIVVDDGLATGSSMRAAVEALQRLRPAAIVVAVPAAPESTCRELNALADKVVCATTPSPFFAVAESYWDFTQTTDEEVRDLLRAALGSRPAAAGGPGPTEVAAIRAEAMPVAEGAPADDMLFDLVGDAHLVLIGEASHGTGEFYTARTQMTRRLIEERGFCAVAAEADWPDAYRVNRYVRGRGEDTTAEEALRGFGPSADRPHAHRDPRSRRAAARRDHRRQGHRRRARAADGRLPRGRSRSPRRRARRRPPVASGRSSAQGGRVPG